MTAAPGSAGYTVRGAREDDLDAIAAFEAEIARVSFGDEAIEDVALHRKRVAGAVTMLRIGHECLLMAHWADGRLVAPLRGRMA